MEGKHKQKIASQVFELALTFGNNVADAKTWVCAGIIWQLSVVFESLLEGFRALSYQIWTHLSNRLDHAEQAALNILEIVSQQFINILVKVQLDRNHEPDWVHFE